MIKTQEEEEKKKTQKAGRAKNCKTSLKVNFVRNVASLYLNTNGHLGFYSQTLQEIFLRLTPVFGNP